MSTNTRIESLKSSIQREETHLAQLRYKLDKLFLKAGISKTSFYCNCVDGAYSKDEILINKCNVCEKPII
jgi:hypothetical protein